MDWSIQDIARLAGTTSRTLRHYDDIGLLPPSRIGANGYRYYDRGALVRLQRILLLRDLGLGLPAVAEVLENQTDAAPALRNHLTWLRDERERLARQIASVESTIHAMEGGEEIMAEDMLDGFDHTQYKDEVEERWGKEAYARSDAWWRSKSPAEKKEWQELQKRLAADWIAAATSGAAPDGEAAQALAQRHFDWLAAIPSTPGSDANGPTKGYLVGLGEMYVADPRFGANYGGQAGAEFVRDALRVYADRNL
ncbi:MerR family transcriptional regulator [Leifsonia poae]|uniref:MerR family transcriptional regulator n=1 Tax=Leifsonia poae TaxID=110933 RepID=A0A9W6H7V8_9MICO|nr:MerR family transcriptional regulator [Leifsonia poae]GLJ75078.1 MerR family transcriptional regulator [Leifsonia poae]